MSLNKSKAERQQRFFCFWRKPEHLEFDVETMIESDEEREQKAIEVSHGSVGEFSKSTASHLYMARKKGCICLFAVLIMLCLTVAILLPICWFGLVPNVSDFMKRSRNVRAPVTTVVEIVMVSVLIISIFSIIKLSRSVWGRVSYLSSCSGESTVSADQGSQTRVKPRSRSDSSRSKRSATSSNLHNVALRQILEDFSPEALEAIQKLAKTYLHSSNGRSAIESGKFIPGIHRPSIYGSTYEDPYRLSAKVLLFGDINVGKTSIFHRILYDQFSESYLQTIGVDLGFSTLYLSNKDEGGQLSVALQIWDIGGQEQLEKISKSYLKDAVIIIPVVDISNVNSLFALKWWFDQISDKVYDPYVVLLLNKADLGDKYIKEDEIDCIENLKGIERFEVSAKTGANVMKAFTDAVAKVIVKETAKLLYSKSS